jgi:hypothetical protein
MHWRKHLFHTQRDCQYDSKKIVNCFEIRPHKAKSSKYKEARMTKFFSFWSKQCSLQSTQSTIPADFLQMFFLFKIICFVFTLWFFSFFYVFAILHTRFYLINYILFECVSIPPFKWYKLLNNLNVKWNIYQKSFNST